jgi:hypothetical protein
MRNARVSLAQAWFVARHVGASREKLTQSKAAEELDS